MDMLYKCLGCSCQEIVKANDHRKDGRRCKKCGGHITPIGYIGIDRASDSDRTVYVTTPRGQKNQKALDIGRTGRRHDKTSASRT